ncbi:hypothetical protein [Nocardiopsis alba]|uniref:hypothetical protein n=1 Tax=Nocardiopsis alba TaxID=53437 RepID=UPI0033BB6AF7
MSEPIRDYTKMSVEELAQEGIDRAFDGYAAIGQVFATLAQVKATQEQTEVLKNGIRELR